MNFLLLFASWVILITSGCLVYSSVFLLSLTYFFVLLSFLLSQSRCHVPPVVVFCVLFLNVPPFVSFPLYVVSMLLPVLFCQALSHVHCVQFLSHFVCSCCVPMCFQFPNHPLVYILSQSLLVLCQSLFSSVLMARQFHVSQFRLTVAFWYFFLYSHVQPKSFYVNSFLCFRVICIWVHTQLHTSCSAKIFTILYSCI